MKEHTVTALWEELRTGEIETDKRGRCGQAALKRYVGPSFCVADERQLAKLDHNNDPENFAYELTTFLFPQLVYSTPKVNITAPEISVEDPRTNEVRLLQAATNQWNRATDMLAFMEQSALDLMFGFCACHVTPTRNEVGYRATLARKEWPEVQRVSDRNLWRDPAALSPEECRWWAYRTVVDRDDLIAHAEDHPEENWNLEALKGLGEQDITSHYHTPEQRRMNLDRKEIELVQMWWPKVDQHEPKDGEIGTIYTLVMLRGDPAAAGTANDVSALFARDPEPYVGAPCGPFITAGVHRVRDSAFTLAPLVALDSQNREHNMQVRAMLDRARKRKQGFISTVDDQKMLEWAESGPEGSVFTLRNVPQTNPVSHYIVPVEIGGITAQDDAATRYTGEILRRVAGMGESQSGAATSGPTATAEAIANASSQLRVERVKQVWRRYIETIELAVAGYIATSKDVKIWIESDLAQAAGVQIPGVDLTQVKGIQYQGGKLSWEDFESLSLTVDVTSIERVTDQQMQARVLQAHAAKLNAIPLMAQVPDPDWWAEEFEMIGDALNVPHQGEHVKQLVKGIQAMLKAGMLQPATPTGTPRVGFGSDAPSSNGQAPKVPASPMGENKTPGLSRSTPNTTALPGLGGER